MVVIKIVDERGTESFGLVELQGDLKSRDNADKFGQFVGDFHFTKDGVPVLIVGHHILHGKVIDLEKPLAVLAPHEQDSDLALRAVITKKILFKTRPKPIVVSPESVKSKLKASNS